MLGVVILGCYNMHSFRKVWGKNEGTADLKEIMKGSKRSGCYPEPLQELVKCLYYGM